MTDNGAMSTTAVARLIGAVLAAACFAVPAHADLTTTTPQATNWGGFVGATGMRSDGEIATGSLFFANFERDARGFCRFALSAIPSGAKVQSAILHVWIANHDLFTSDPVTCPLPARVKSARTDPLVAAPPEIFAAIAAGAVYQAFTVDRTGPTYCPDSFKLFDLDLGAQAASDVEAAIAQGFVTLGFESDINCDAQGDHLDWISYDEVVDGGGIDCDTVPFPGSRIKLDVTWSAPTCVIGNVMPIALVRAFKMADKTSVALSWTVDPEAESYNVWYVLNKDELPLARAGQPVAAAPIGCSPTSTTTCVHANGVPAVPAGPRLYYQVRGVCRASEAAE